MAFIWIAWLSEVKLNKEVCFTLLLPASGHGLPASSVTRMPSCFPHIFIGGGTGELFVSNQSMYLLYGK